MPKRKKLPEYPNYIDSGRNSNELLVQKSNPLQSLSETAITLPELKILDAYLARINSHHEEARYVRFEKGELEKLLGVVKIPRDELSKRLNNLFVAITIHDERKDKGFTKIGLFEKANCEQDDNGLWQVDLACTVSAMEYFFNPERIGYFKYRLHNVVNLTSRYSYVLYLYFEKQRNFKTWSISIEELRKILNCNATRYTQYKFFNSEILKKCQKELSEKTDCKFSYKALNAKKQELKPRQKAAFIQFTLETEADIDKDQISFDDISITQNGDLLLSDAVNNEFTAAQMDEIFQMICMLPLESPNGIDIARFHYLSQMYAKLNAAAERNKLKGKSIKDRYKYFLSILKKDMEK